MQKRGLLNSFTLSLIALSTPHAHGERWLGSVCGASLANDGNQGNTGNQDNGGTPGSTGNDDGTLGTAGLMTMWTTNPTDIQSSSCEMAHPASVAQGNDWLDPYVTNNRRYCAVDDKLKASGMSCGSCYKITYTGEKATDPGRPGSAVIQVVDSGSAKEFDCFLDVFEEITGSKTGVFPIYYKQVDCVETPPTVVVLEGNNVWYTKILVVGGHTGVQSVSITVDGKRYDLQRNGGATWSTGLSGKSGPTLFSITYRDGTSAELLGCFGGKWPVAPSSQCASN